MPNKILDKVPKFLGYPDGSAIIFTILAKYCLYICGP